MFYFLHWTFSIFLIFFAIISCLRQSLFAPMMWRNEANFYNKVLIYFSLQIHERLARKMTWSISCNCWANSQNVTSKSLRRSSPRNEIQTSTPWWRMGLFGCVGVYCLQCKYLFGYFKLLRGKFFNDYTVKITITNADTKLKIFQNFKIFLFYALEIEPLMKISEIFKNLY